MKMYSVARKVICGLVLTGITTLASGFDYPIFKAMPNRNLYRTERMALYDWSGNPAFFRTAYHEDYNFYTAHCTRQTNRFHRQYDPQASNDYQLHLLNIKQISERLTLCTTISYQRLDQSRVFRSLEKEFYTAPFALSDTTSGNVSYDGPRISFLYNCQITANCLAGIAVNYGVERGLKDVFTQCETIMRDIDLTGGLGLVRDNLELGAFGRYFNVQSKYEAVKYLQDALVNTWFGYHVYFPENPRATNRKNDDRMGYECGLQAALNDFLFEGLRLQMGIAWGAKSTEVTVGSVSIPNPRGYAVREGNRIVAGFDYWPAQARYGIQLLYDNQTFTEWAEANPYEVIVMENEVRQDQVRLCFQTVPRKTIRVALGGELTFCHDDYREFILPFGYQEIRNGMQGFGEVQLTINPVLTCLLRGWYGRQEPYFYWNTAEFREWAVQCGFERLFVLGRFGLEGRYAVQRPSAGEKTNTALGLFLTYRR